MLIVNLITSYLLYSECDHNLLHMIYNLANIGHVNYALTGFAIILVLSILFSGCPIPFAQGPRQVGLNHIIHFCSRTRQ